MKLPYVIDNNTSRLVDVLSALLTEFGGRSLDVATAYFTVTGFGLIRDGLAGLGSLRLLIGQEPTAGAQVGLRPDAGSVGKEMRRDLEQLPFSEETLRVVEDLVSFLRRDKCLVRVHKDGFLHAKAWLFYSDRPGQQMLFDRFRPVAAIVGSSNFTFPGLTSNRELNIAHKVLLDLAEVQDDAAREAVGWLSENRPSERISPENQRLLKSEVGARAIIDLEQWFEREWESSVDFKEDLIGLLDASKFGTVEYTPYDVYLKALFEYFRDELDQGDPLITKSAIELAEFQDDAVRKARAILLRYDGVMIADSVGLGKTWIGKKLLEDFAYHLRQKAIVICPASLRDMWNQELADATIAAQVISQEEMGREEFELGSYGDADVVLVDESHNFRNPNAQRTESLERLLQAGGGRGQAGYRKKVILLTATPINNDLFDLYNQLLLITGGDRSYFAAAGIGDLYRYFLRARRSARREGVFALFNLLEEVVIRRTRPFIRTAYPEATIRGEKIKFPERKLRTVQYDLEQAYSGIYDEVVSGVEALKLAPYNLEAYKKAEEEVDEFEAGREQALVGIFKSRYLKRFESSVHAFRISVRRALAFLKTFESYILEGRILRSTDFQKAIRFLSREDEEDDATPRSVAEDLDDSEEAQQLLEELGEIDPAHYDLRRLHEAVQHDVEALTEIWHRIKDITAADDAKLARLKALLASEELRGQKVLVFSYYKDTARYLYKHLGHPESPEAVAFLESLGGAKMRRLDSGASPKERLRTVQAFAPRANQRPEWVSSERELDILISTDVLSEGQNLQDCGLLINYDLHWNPTRMVQRAGRIDRIGSEFDTLWIYNMFPDAGLEKLLRLVERLSQKISDIDQAGFLDASVLGESVHPKNFNTLRRIGAEDETVLQEEEQFSELASNEFMLQQLRSFLAGGGQEKLDELPDGIHSGLLRERARGVFFYFKAERPGHAPLHFWRYYDLLSSKIQDNRFLISSLISCSPDTKRVVDPDMFGAAFDLQEKVIDDILQSVQQQQALEEAPRALDPLQQTVATALQEYINHPDIERPRIIDAIRFLGEPFRKAAIRELRRIYEAFRGGTGSPVELVEGVERLQAELGERKEAAETCGGS